MNDLIAWLGGKQVIVDCVREFGGCDSDLLQSASPMGAGERLIREMKQAVDSMVPTNFDDFAQLLHESSAGQ